MFLSAKHVRQASHDTALRSLVTPITVVTRITFNITRQYISSISIVLRLCLGSAVELPITPKICG